MRILETSVAITRVRALLYRAKVDRPVVTSFGSLSDRPALFVEVEDVDGVRGWGEVWCNFPVFAAEQRARFLQRVIAPMFEGTKVAEPTDAGNQIDRILGIQAIQAGEEGLVSSLGAGLDQALWDLVARRAAQPLWRLFGGTNDVAVCASSLGPQQALEMIARESANGHRAFKLKVGFGDRIDIETISSVRGVFGDDVVLMVDANQAWSARRAIEVAERLVAFNPLWLEEPVRADEPLRVWRELSARCPIPIASGENIRSKHGFTPFINGSLLQQVQPDVGKWGGISDCLAVGRRAVASGIGYSPHWLGGGIGLAVSLNLLGAVGGAGFAEIDVNPNPLREAFPLPVVREGTVQLSEEPGFGFEPDLRALETYRCQVE
ncbi:MAG: mandelate racemase/muconate lactonizing enzyme family protein [Solirubrobacteraceae bacterium]